MPWKRDSNARALPTPAQTEEVFNALFGSYLVEIENDWLEFDTLDSYASKILDARYEKFNVEDVVVAQSHLTPTQRSDLAKLLKKHWELFSEKLDLYQHKKMILSCSQGLRQYMPDIILCQEYIKTHSERSLNT